MSRLIITPSLNEKDENKLASYILDCDCWFYCCPHQSDDFDECKLCLEECTKMTIQWIRGQPGSFDHNVLRYLTKISIHFPTHLFIGYSSHCEWQGCRLDRYIIKNGTEISRNTIYLNKNIIDWTQDYDDEFNRQKAMKNLISIKIGKQSDN